LGHRWFDGQLNPKGNPMKQLALRFARDERGVTAIEYGLIAAGVAVVIISTVQGLGTNLKATFSSVSTALK
jgi:pilus assembly protein Flp/PilA